MGLQVHLHVISMDYRSEMSTQMHCSLWIASIGKGTMVALLCDFLTLTLLSVKTDAHKHSSIPNRISMYASTMHYNKYVFIHQLLWRYESY